MILMLLYVPTLLTFRALRYSGCASLRLPVATQHSSLTNARDDSVLW